MLPEWSTMVCTVIDYHHHQLHLQQWNDAGDARGGRFI